METGYKSIKRTPKNVNLNTEERPDTSKKPLHDTSELHKYYVGIQTTFHNGNLSSFQTLLQEFDLLTTMYYFHADQQFINYLFREY